MTHWVVALHLLVCGFEFLPHSDWLVYVPCDTRGPRPGCGPAPDMGKAPDAPLQGKQLENGWSSETVVIQLCFAGTLYSVGQQMAAYGPKLACLEKYVAVCLFSFLLKNTRWYLTKIDADKYSLILLI